MNQCIVIASLMLACFLQLPARAEEGVLPSEPGAVPPARELYQRAATALLAKNLPLASAELGRLVEHHPTDDLAPLAALRLAECHLAQGEARLAAQVIETWLPKLQQSPRTLALEPASVLRAHLVAARADFLADHFDVVIKIARQQVDVHARRSSLTPAENSLLDQLRELADQATKKQEQQLGTELRAAADQVRGKRFSEALCTLEQCDLGSLTPAWRWRYHVLHAQCILGQGDAQAALEELDGIELPKLTDQERTALRMACLDAAMAGQQMERAEAEINGLAMAAEKDEQVAATLALRRVEVAVFRKERDKAQKLAVAGKQAYPKFAAVHEFDLLLARNAIAQIKFDEARQILQSIIQSPPSTDPTAAPRAQWLLGESYFLSQEYAKALSAYTTVIENGSAPTWTETALMQRGKCYELLDNASAAAADYQRLLQEFAQSSLSTAARARLADMQPVTRGASIPSTIIQK